MGAPPLHIDMQHTHTHKKKKENKCSITPLDSFVLTLWPKKKCTAQSKKNKNGCEVKHGAIVKKNKNQIKRERKKKLKKNTTNGKKGYEPSTSEKQRGNSNKKDILKCKLQIDWPTFVTSTFFIVFFSVVGGKSY